MASLEPQMVTFEALRPAVIELVTLRLCWGDLASVSTPRAEALGAFQILSEQAALPSIRQRKTVNPLPPTLSPSTFEGSRKPREPCPAPWSMSEHCDSKKLIPWGLQVAAGNRQLSSSVGGASRSAWVVPRTWL